MMSKEDIPKVSKSFKKKHPAINTLIVVTAVVAIWRGIWGLMDLYVLPHAPLWSFVVSFIFGLVALLVDDFRLDELR